VTTETKTVARSASSPGKHIQNKQPLPFYENFGGYRVKKVLGAGGFGFVYLCYEDKMSRYVAIKEYFPRAFAMRNADGVVFAEKKDQNAFQWGLDSFIEEAKNLEKLKDCPNIVKVLTNFETNGTAYMVMEYIDGKQTLSDYFSHANNRVEKKIVSIIEPLLVTLKAVHDMGFIHRDIKPSNILLKNDGTPVLLDFGSARQAFLSKTDHWTEIGSPGFRAIEQYVKDSDRREGPWTDIFGLASTLYYAVVGQQPVDTLDRLHQIQQLGLQDPYKPAQERGEGVVSDQLLKAIDWALCLDEAQRPQSIGDWRRAIDNKSKLSSKQRSLKPTLFGLAILIVALSGVGAYFYKTRLSADQNPFGLSIEAERAVYSIGDELAFNIQATTGCHFLVFTTDSVNGFQWHNPADQAANMGTSALKPGERRSIPIDGAPDVPRVDPPTGQLQLGGLCTIAAMEQAEFERIQNLVGEKSTTNLDVLRSELTSLLGDSKFSITTTELQVVE